MRIAITVVLLILVGLLVYSLWAERGFWKSIFSEEDKGSFSRVASAVLVVNTCAWTWLVVLHTHEIPYIALVAMVPFTAQFYIANVTAAAASKAIGNNKAKDHDGAP